MGDEGHYILNALHIARGQFAEVNAFWSLFYSAVSALPVMLGAQPDVACRLVNLGSVVALVPAAAGVAAVAFGPAAAVLTAWMVATCPIVAGTGPTCFSEPVAVLLAALALGLALPRKVLRAGRDSTEGRYLVAGVLATLSTFGRIEMAPLILVVVACALAAPGQRPYRAPLAAVIGTGVGAVLLGLVLQAGGWTWDYLGKAGNIMMVSQGLMDPSAEKELSKYGLTPDGESVAEVRARTRDKSFYLTPRMAVPVASRLMRKWPDVVGKFVKGCASPLPLLLAPIGVLLVRRRGRFRIVPWAIAIAAVPPLVGAACVAPHGRYIMQSVPFVIVLAAGGVAGCILRRPEEEAAEGELVKGRMRPTRALLVWIALLVLLPAPFAVYRPLASLAEVPDVYRDAGLWMRDNVPPGRMLCKPGTWVSYWAGIPEYTFFPACEAGAAVDFARRKGSRYLVLDGRLSLETRPGIRELIGGDEAMAERLGLRRLYDNEVSGLNRVVIYEVVGTVPNGRGQDP